MNDPQVPRWLVYATWALALLVGATTLLTLANAL